MRLCGGLFMNKGRWWRERDRESEGPVTRLGAVCSWQDLKVPNGSKWFSVWTVGIFPEQELTTYSHVMVHMYLWLPIIMNVYGKQLKWQSGVWWQFAIYAKPLQVLLLAASSCALTSLARSPTVLAMTACQTEKAWQTALIFHRHSRHNWCGKI